MAGCAFFFELLEVLVIRSEGWIADRSSLNYFVVLAQPMKLGVEKW